MKTALEILARRRRARSVALPVLGGYREPTPEQSVWDVFVLFARYSGPDDPEEEILERAFALMASPHRRS